MTWKICINQAPQSPKIGDIQQYLSRDNENTTSPIDSFYRNSQELLRVGEPTFLANHPYMGGLLLVGLVSATENYFRDVLSRIISICPIAQNESADETISLGAVIWHDPTNAIRGTFEHFSFASASSVTKYCQKYTGLHLTGCRSILEEFDKVCELRHGIVHADACVPGKNAVKLQIPPHRGVIRIRVGFPELQEAGSICTNVVTSINIELFVKMIQRWGEDWRRLPTWNISGEVRLFEAIWGLFYSHNDREKGSVRRFSR